MSCSLRWMTSNWVGHLGRNKQTKTPNIDRLAGMGVTFANAQCAARSATRAGRRCSVVSVQARRDL